MKKQNHMASGSSKAILREQKQIRREQFFSNKGMVIGMVVFAIIVLSAIFIPMFNGVDPDAMDVVNRLKPPSAEHIFGTVIGIDASYFKVADAVLMRICEGLTAIPGILLAIALMAALGASNTNVIIALTIVYTPSVARVVRSSALVAKGRLYVEAAKVQGASSGRILGKLILPNVISPLTVQASYIFAQAIISEASLSFLGAGIPAPAASWGNILQSSKSVLSKSPWPMVFPGLAVVLCVLSLNLLGDGLRDYLDPRTAGRKKK